jgi:hypothetical protein
MSWKEGPLTLKANATLEAHRRVKIDTGASTADPPKVVYAGAGEDYIGVTEYSAATGDLVAVRQAGYGGTLEIRAKVDSAINVGTTLYGAANGQVSDTSSGSAQGIALQVASASGDQIEVAPLNTKSTTAATVSIADAGNYTAQTTVEAALQEIYLHLLGTQGFLPVPLATLKTGSTDFVSGTSAVTSFLATDTTPKIGRITNATDPAQVVTWATGDVGPVFFQMPLPPDLDEGAALVLHARVKGSGAVNIPTWTIKSYFNEGDTLVSDSIAASTATTTWTEVTGTIAAADVPAGAQTLSCSLTPAAHTTNHFYMSAMWFEYSRVKLTV